MIDIKALIEEVHGRLERGEELTETQEIILSLIQQINECGG